MIELPDVDRREVRVRLVEKADSWLRAAPGVTVADGLPMSAAVGDDVADAVLGVEHRGDGSPFRVHELLYALARLMDRPTCRVETGNDSGVCSACGEDGIDHLDRFCRSCGGGNREGGGAVGVTDEHRREIAECLRKNADSWLEQCPSGDADRDAWEIMGDIVLSIGPGCDQGEVRAVDLLDLLADLIDRPTCRLVRYETSGHAPNGVRCTNCEEVYVLENTRDWRYCPSCGAEVVE